jgi:hypothetical protein
MIVFLFEISPTKRSISEENIPKTSAQKNVFIPKILKLKDIIHISRKMIKCFSLTLMSLGRTHSFELKFLGYSPQK